MLAESEIVSAAREAGFRIITNEETVTLMRVARVVEVAAYAKAAGVCDASICTAQAAAVIRALAQAKEPTR